jgi:hypothetical protein
MEIEERIHWLQDRDRGRQWLTGAGWMREAVRGSSDDRSLQTIAQARKHCRLWVDVDAASDSAKNQHGTDSTLPDAHKHALPRFSVLVSWLVGQW